MITYHDEFAQMGLNWHQWQCFNPDPGSHTRQCEQVAEWWHRLPELDRAEYVLINHGYYQDYQVAQEYLEQLDIQRDTDPDYQEREKSLADFNAYLQQQLQGLKRS